MKFLKHILVAFSFVFALGVFAEDDIPKVSRLLVDKSGFLSKTEQQNLEQKLIQISRETSNQILIYISTDLNGYDISDFAQRLGAKNKVGQKEQDNGVVIVVKPKTSQSRGQTFIAVGHGLEGAIPDITAKKIVDKELLPHFKAGQNYQGLLSAVEVVESLAKGEYNYKKYQKSKKKKGFLSGLISFFFILFVVFFSITRRVRGYARTNNLGFWAAWSLLGAGSRKHDGYFDNFHSGGGDFGGFGGFGGGSFGGGGAGGSW